VINGQPMIMFEADDGNVAHVSVQLPRTLLVDNQIVPLVLRNGSVVVPTEDGPFVIPISEFHVLMVNGRVVLLAEENPWILIPIAFYGLLGGAAGGTFFVALGAKKAGAAKGAAIGAVMGGLYGAIRR